MLGDVTEAPTSAEWGDPGFRSRVEAAYSGEYDVADAVGWLSSTASGTGHPLELEVRRLQGRVFSGTVVGPDYDDSVARMQTYETQIAADRLAIREAVHAARTPPAELEFRGESRHRILPDDPSPRRAAPIARRLWVGVALLIGLTIGAVGGVLGSGSLSTKHVGAEPEPAAPAPAQTDLSISVFDEPQTDVDLIGFSPSDAYLGDTSRLLAADPDSGVRLFGVQRSDDRTCLLAAGAEDAFADNCFVSGFGIPMLASVSWRFGEGETAVSGEGYWLSDDVAIFE